MVGKDIFIFKYIKKHKKLENFDNNLSINFNFKKFFYFFLNYLLFNGAISMKIFNFLIFCRKDSSL